MDTINQIQNILTQEEQAIRTVLAEVDGENAQLNYEHELALLDNRNDAIIHVIEETSGQGIDNLGLVHDLASSNILEFSTDAGSAEDEETRTDIFNNLPMMNSIESSNNSTLDIASSNEFDLANDDFSNDSLSSAISNLRLAANNLGNLFRLSNSNVMDSANTSTTCNDDNLNLGGNGISNEPLDPLTKTKDIGNGDYALSRLDSRNAKVDGIQEDLMSFMSELNDFIGTQEWYQPDIIEVEDSDHDEEEKQDGPQEKEYCFLNMYSYSLRIKFRLFLDQSYHLQLFNLNVIIFSQILQNDSFYVCDGDNPPEINWQVLAPFIQSTVEDLQKINKLNAEVGNLIARVREVASSKEMSDNPQ